MRKVVMPSSKSVGIRHDPKTGRWHFNVRITKDDGSVFRRQGNRKTEKEARRMRDLAYAEFNRDQGEERDRPKRMAKDEASTFKRWAEHCIENVWPGHMAPNTVAAYRSKLRIYVYEEIGDLPLDMLSASMIQQMLDGMSADIGRRCRTATVAVLRHAVQRGKITSNPAKETSPRKDRSVRVAERALTMQEMEKIIDACRDTVMYWPVVLGAKFGLRIGEATGLTWENVDLDRKIVSVRQQMQWEAGKGGVLSQPKSSSSVRDVPIPASVLEELREAKQSAKGNFLWEEQSATFPHKKQSRIMHKAFEAAGVKDVKPGHHKLRSGYLTHMANVVGAKPSVLMRLAGHSDIAMTMKHYVKASVDELAEAVKDL